MALHSTRITLCINISTNTKQAGLRGVCPSLGRSWARDRVFYANIRPINTIGPTRAIPEPFPNGRPYTESQNPGIQYNMCMPQILEYNMYIDIAI